jgi:hypothetical protein
MWVEGKSKMSARRIGCCRGKGFAGPLEGINGGEEEAGGGVGGRIVMMEKNGGGCVVDTELGDEGEAVDFEVGGEGRGEDGCGSGEVFAVAVVEVLGPEREAEPVFRVDVEVESGAVPGSRGGIFFGGHA